MDTRYQVSFHGTASTDDSSRDGQYTLQEAIETCQAFGCEADLYDEPGFRKGWVHPDGKYTLT